MFHYPITPQSKHPLSLYQLVYPMFYGTGDNQPKLSANRVAGSLLLKRACQLAMLKSNRATRSGFPAIQFNERLVEMILDRLFPPVSLKSFAMLAGLATFRQGHVSSSASELPHVRTLSRCSQTLKITGNTILAHSCYGLPNQKNACPCSEYARHRVQRGMLREKMAARRLHG